MGGTRLGRRQIARRHAWCRCRAAAAPAGAAAGAEHGRRRHVEQLAAWAASSRARSAGQARRRASRTARAAWSRRRRTRGPVSPCSPSASPWSAVTTTSASSQSRAPRDGAQAAEQLVGPRDLAVVGTIGVRASRRAPAARTDRAGRRGAPTARCARPRRPACGHRATARRARASRRRAAAPCSGTRRVVVARSRRCRRSASKPRSSPDCFDSTNDDTNAAVVKPRAAASRPASARRGQRQRDVVADAVFGGIEAGEQRGVRRAGDRHVRAWRRAPARPRARGDRSWAWARWCCRRRRADRRAACRW